MSWRLSAASAAAQHRRERKQASAQQQTARPGRQGQVLELSPAPPPPYRVSLARTQTTTSLAGGRRRHRWGKKAAPLRANRRGRTAASDAPRAKRRLSPAPFCVCSSRRAAWPEPALRGTAQRTGLALRASGGGRKQGGGGGRRAEPQPRAGPVPGAGLGGARGQRQPQRLRRPRLVSMGTRSARPAQRTVRTARAALPLPPPARAARRCHSNAAAVGASWAPLRREVGPAGMGPSGPLRAAGTSH